MAYAFSSHSNTELLIPGREVQPQHGRLVIAAAGRVHHREIGVDVDDVELGPASESAAHEHMVEDLCVALEVVGVHIVVGQRRNEVDEHLLGAGAREQLRQVVRELERVEIAEDNEVPEAVIAGDERVDLIDGGRLRLARRFGVL